MSEPSAATEIWRLSWPAMCRNILNCAADRLTLAIVGHYDYAQREHYDGAAIGKMYSNVTALSVGFGLNLGLATLVSNSFGAGRGARENGLHLRRALALLAGPALAIAATAALFAEPLMRALGQPPAVAHSAARFAQVQLPGVPLYWTAHAIQTTCDGCQRTRPGMYMQFVSACVQLALCAALVPPRDRGGAGLGYLGMAAGRAACGLVQCGAVAALVRRDPWLRANVWGAGGAAAAAAAAADGARGGDADADADGVADGVADGASSPPPPRPACCGGGARRALRLHVAVALPSALCLWVEWWAFEALAVIVGRLDEPELELAAHGALFAVVAIVYQTFTGLSTSLCVSLGRALGARGASGRGDDDARRARALLNSALALAAAAALAIAGALVAARRPLAALLTADADVRRELARTAWAAAVCVVPYACTMTCFGGCRGAGRQRSAVGGIVLGYCVGLPLAWALGPARAWRGGPAPLAGVWLGNAAALVISAVWVGGVVARLPLRTLTLPRATPGFGAAAPKPSAGTAADDDMLVAALLPESDEERPGSRGPVQ